MKNVKPKKNLGQHFLIDLGVAKAIADTVDACPDIPVLEVGPGMGVLTQYLTEKPRELRVVEIDRESVAYLHEHFPQLDGKVVSGDFLRMDLNALFEGRIPTISLRRSSSRCLTTRTLFRVAQA